MISTQGREGGGAASHGRQAVAQASPSSVVHRPLPEKQVKDARTYQIEQLRRRYSPKELELASGSTSLVFDLKPSDPDFPFDLDRLECDLRVPQRYPDEPPELKVLNKDIPRGFSVNVERGWDKLVQQKRGATLLALTNALDRSLEVFLSEQKVETVKFTRFTTAPTPSGSHAAPEAPLSEAQPSQPAPEPRPAYMPDEPFSKEDTANAKARRAQETRQLEARLGTMPLYHKSVDGVVYTLPLEPKRRSELPVGLRNVGSVQLIVPLLYPLQPIRILLNDADSTDAEAVEELFVQKAMAQKQMSLTSHLNYLAQNLNALAAQVRKEQEERAKADAAGPSGSAERTTEQVATQLSSLDIGKGPVQVVPRPPEWHYGGQDTDSSEDADMSEEDEDEGLEDGGAALDVRPVEQPAMQGPAVERGTALLFPSVELYGVELLQVSLLALSVKCQRCKTANEITGLKDGVEKLGSCSKCATAFTLRYRPEFIHQHSARAGFIDATGCTVADLLPSTFIPTCARCSTPGQPLVSVRGEAVTNVCRECHARFTFKLPDSKLLAYAASAARPPPAPGPRRRQQDDKKLLGVRAGEPLPLRGACAHYRRSYRWFRFTGCCGRLHPCDRCHDAAEDHACESWGAARMVCGWCSREQRYHPDTCAFCGRSVIAKKGKGYWEGGRGTRDPVLMRRGDRRKFRRVGGGGGGGGGGSAGAGK